MEKYAYIHWTRIAPYGQWPNRNHLQILTPEYASALCDRFEQSPSCFIPIYRGHPDDPELSGKEGHKDTQVYGEVLGLEVRDDGLWANIGWSPEGFGLLGTTPYQALSVRWTLEAMDASQHGLYPTQIHSLGLTHQPNIPETYVNTMKEKTIELTQGLQQRLQINAASCDAQTLEQALDTCLSNTQEAQEEAHRFFKLAEDRQEAYESTLKEKAQLQEASDQLKRQHIDDTVQLALLEKRIPAHEAQLWRERLAQNYDAAFKELKEKGQVFSKRRLNNSKGLPRVQAAVNRSDIIRRVQERSKRTGEPLSLAWNRTWRAQGF